ncbi:MAG: SRPBCC domain-containing protein [Candidatus Heimdallarchaeota archaeon]
MKIAIEAIIPVSVESLWDAWTNNDVITKWFSPEANIEPRVGGPFELFFDPADHSHESTQGCVLTRVEEKNVLEFTWKGPGQFAEVMNDPASLTTVKVEFSGEAETTRLKLEHKGWGTSPDWDDARRWHEEQWNKALDELKGFFAAEH